MNLTMEHRTARYTGDIHELLYDRVGTISKADGGWPLGLLAKRAELRAGFDTQAGLGRRGSLIPGRSGSAPRAGTTMN